MIADRYVQYMVAYRVDHDTLENSIAGEHFTAQKAMDVGYSAGDFVVYGDEFYRCKQSYKDYILPTNTSYWEKIILTSYFSHSTDHNYSTTEHVVGTWIDGKPLYEITVEDTLSVSTSPRDLLIIGLTDKQVRNIVSCTARVSDTFVLDNGYNDGSSWKFMAYLDGGNLRGYAAWGSDPLTVSLTFQYTKTTD